MRQIRTDLAMEVYQAAGCGDIPGAQINQWEQAGVHITEVMIETEEGARALGKPIGSYLTLEAPLLREGDADVRLAISNILAEEIGRMLTASGVEQGSEGDPVLVVGLGNRRVTPDCIGPMTADRTLVTRHMLREAPGAAGMRSVCAFVPGVLGVTGLETAEMIESLVQRLHPRAVICVDSLAARDASRIGCAIQMTDAGIQPGSGVGNHRRPLTRATLGCEVIAIGMPTVIYASTLAMDAIRALRQDDTDIEAGLRDTPLNDMIVTPREIDSMTEQAAQIIASGINKALQPQLSDAEIAAMMD